MKNYKHTHTLKINIVGDTEGQNRLSFPVPCALDLFFLMVSKVDLFISYQRNSLTLLGAG